MAKINFTEEDEKAYTDLKNQGIINQSLSQFVKQAYFDKITELKIKFKKGDF